MNKQGKRNYQKEMEVLINKLEREGVVPTLFLHSCCAPCSSYVLEYLSQYFKITVFYYNPNIFPLEEFEKRIEEQRSLIERMPAKHSISFIAGDYDSEKFYQMAKGLEQVPEGGERCFKCFELRLRKTAELAKEILNKKGRSPAGDRPDGSEITERQSEQRGRHRSQNPERSRSQRGCTQRRWPCLLRC